MYCEKYLTALKINDRILFPVNQNLSPAVQRAIARAEESNW